MSEEHKTERRPITNDEAIADWLSVPIWKRRAVQAADYAQVHGDEAGKKFREALLAVGLIDFDARRYEVNWMSEIFGITRKTADRWCFDGARIPRYAIAYVELAKELQDCTVKLQECMAQLRECKAADQSTVTGERGHKPLTRKQIRRGFLRTPSMLK